MKLKIIAVGCLLFFGFMLHYIRIGRTLPFMYYDEAWWIGQSYFYDLFLHDRKNPLWDSVYSYDQPQLVHYIFGAMLYPKFRKENTPNFLRYLSDHHLLCQECIRASSLPSGITTISQEQFSRNINTPAYIDTREVILYVRALNAYVAAATVVIIFFWGLAMWGVGGGLLFGLLYGFNSLIMKTALVAHADALFLFFYSCALLMMYRSLAKNNKMDPLYIGLCIGFASSVKIVGFILVPMVMIAQVLRRSAIRKRLIDCIVVSIISLSIFIMLNPFVYQDTLHRLIIMYQHRAAQQQLFSVWFSDQSLPSLSTRLYSIGEQFFPVRVLWYSVPLSLVGLVSFFRNFRTRKIHGFVPILGYCIIVLSLQWLSVRWDRYYAPIVWVVIATQVEGMVYIFRTIYSRMPRTS